MPYEHMQFSSDEKHQASLQLLRDVQAYLDSHVPPHPQHYRMARRIEAHLAEPTHRLVARAQQEREGTCWTPAGVPLMEAVLVANVVKLKIPLEAVDLTLHEFDERTVLEEAVSRLLGNGLLIGLQIRSN